MAVNILLHLDGITGESQISGFEEKIDIISFSWGASQSGTTHMGSGAGSGKSDIQDLSLTKYIDSSTCALLQFLCQGNHIATGKLTVRKVGGDSPMDYLTVDMEEIIVSSLSTGGSGDADRISETVSLNFRKFQIQYWMQSGTGTPENKGDFTWDISAQA